MSGGSVDAQARFRGAGDGRVDVVVLAGGRASRMGGADKPVLPLGGVTLLDRVLAAVAGSGRLVVVGPRRATAYDVTWCREEPPGAGPAAALAAGLTHVDAPLVVALAADLPFVDAALVAELCRAVTDDGAVAVDAGGSPQWLCSAWRTASLAGAGLAADASLRGTLGRLRWAPVPVGDARVMDCDTPEDLRRARERLQ